MISYAQLCEALAGAGPVHVPIPAPPAPLTAVPSAAQPLPPAPAPVAPDDHENTVTNLNLASVDSAADPDELGDEVEIGDAEIDSEE